MILFRISFLRYQSQGDYSDVWEIEGQEKNGLLT